MERPMAFITDVFLGFFGQCEELLASVQGAKNYIR